MIKKFDKEYSTQYAPEMKYLLSKGIKYCFVKDVILTSLEEKHNSKNPLVKYNGLGYMPGEIYSLGIIYQYEDNTYSPVCHIPGKSPHVAKNVVFSPEAGVYPMSNIKNQNQSETYYLYSYLNKPENITREKTKEKEIEKRRRR